MREGLIIWDSPLLSTRFCDFTLDENNDQARSNLEILQEKLNGDECDDNREKALEPEDYYMQHKYEALCRGEYQKQYAKKRLLDGRYICGYMNSDPTLTLQPVKYEILSIDPEVYIYYEMVTNLETRVLKRLAFPHVSISTTSILILYFAIFHTSLFAAKMLISL